MSTIIAGLFNEKAAADCALAALEQWGIDTQDRTSFYSTPPGQHAMLATGGDAHHDEGTKHAGHTALTGGAIGAAAGLAVGAVAATAIPAIAPAAAVAGAGIGAYVGALAGGLGGTEAGEPAQASVDEPVELPAGMIVAVRADAPATQRLAYDMMRGCDAQVIELAKGQWQDGKWVDYDPRRPHTLLYERPARGR